MDIKIQILNLAGLRPMDRNARKMSNTDMERLIKNIEQDGKLTSTPLVYRDMRIISGHHRVEAAIKAGVKESPCMVITSEVSDDHLTAIQLSHNAIAGVDDPDILKQMLESLPPLEQEFSAVKIDDLQMLRLGSSIIRGMPEVEVVLRFLPAEVTEIKEAVEKISKAAKDEEINAFFEPSDLLDEFIDAFFAVKDFGAMNPDQILDLRSKWTETQQDKYKNRYGKGIIPAPAALILMSRLAMSKIQDLQDEGGSG